MTTKTSIEPNQAYQLEGPGAVPYVVIGEKRWPIPLLAPRQNRIVVPLVMKFTKVLVATEGKFTPDLLDRELYDDLLAIVFHGLTRAHPALTWEEFLDWEFTTEEMMMAFPVIGDATGVAKKRSYKPGEAPQGEVQAGTVTAS